MGPISWGRNVITDLFTWLNTPWGPQLPVDVARTFQLVALAFLLSSLIPLIKRGAYAQLNAIIAVIALLTVLVSMGLQLYVTNLPVVRVDPIVATRWLFMYNSMLAALFFSLHFLFLALQRERRGLE